MSDQSQKYRYYISPCFANYVYINLHDFQTGTQFTKSTGNLLRKKNFYLGVLFITKSLQYEWVTSKQLMQNDDSGQFVDSAKFQFFPIFVLYQQFYNNYILLSMVENINVQP